MMESSRVRVLLVDDTPQIRAIFGRFLTLAGMEVTVAADGVLGLEAARASLPEAIICDLDMPNMGGLALVRALRAEPATKSVAIVLVSGSGALQTSEALDAGCDAVLVKPCSGALLIRTVERLLMEARTRSEASSAAESAASG